MSKFHARLFPASFLPTVGCTFFEYRVAFSDRRIASFTSDIASADSRLIPDHRYTPQAQEPTTKSEGCLIRLCVEMRLAAFLMKLSSLTLSVLLLTYGAQAEDVCRFTPVEIPRNESRLLELARVVEYRCECVLPRLDEDSQFIAERYQNGKCVSRQAFSLGKYSNDREGDYKGTIAFGWHEDDHILVGVHDTGYFHQTDIAKLANFTPTSSRVWSFFKESRAEQRAGKSGLSVKLFPIIGIRGGSSAQRTRDIPSLPQEEMTRFFQTSSDSIIVYLSFGAGLPDFDYDKNGTDPAQK